MTVKERLEKLSPGDMVYIAKSNSSGFFFIGPAGEWRETVRFRKFDNCEVIDEWKRETYEPGIVLKIDTGKHHNPREAGQSGAGGYWFRSEYLEGLKARRITRWMRQQWSVWLTR